MLRSFMNKGPFIFFLSIILFLLAGCSEDKKQQEFENEARLNLPEGITEMTAHGERKENGVVDEQDWRISPDYAGLIHITAPAYPNPVAPGQQFRIDIDFGFDQTVNSFVVYAMNDNSNTLVELYSKNDPPPTDTIVLNSSFFGDQIGVGNSNIYRIFIYDGQDNIITYGDVKVE